MANMIIYSVANFPDSLTKFECYPLMGFSMQSLPSLPPTLQVLTITNAPNFNTLPLLPLSLKHLNIAGRRFSSLPPLPIGLEYLELQYLLFNLSSLPIGLKYLALGGIFDSLPSLPNSIEYLGVFSKFFKTIAIFTY